ncbi:TIGR03747 family integrating conjugative element membrane protein [Paracidovorax valerianellae]|uniref:Integrating conjugative element membrane protein, PFL_4697 family n=1 Tax=Paracidovorax valerianellae TaxID=187868 RepID=A0A1G7EI52_9BURK|nr:TIGR03747 family integrating conjugative element membrane protein [Paracidovorax valerianellae]MDA8446368.1 TIGR03747 family integrating conjugative element membrane protein [Paracidovorax valerianellae]SDE63370.1 integrating conjugative element membrane protein, PFL_4697 family [Paracidovorax valerianellae]
MSEAPSKGPVRPRTRGPVELALEVGIGLTFVALFSWFVGILIEIGGMYLLWKDEGVGHARALVEQDLGYIAAAPRSLLVPDTVAFSERIVHWVQMPYERLGVLRWYARFNGPQAAPESTQAEAGAAAGGNPLPKGVGRVSRSMGKLLSQWALVSMYIAQDVLLRMSVALFALPAFVLACLVGAVDGLVRRDLRRWGGGRESSFVYHHAKRYTAWSLTGGFGLYLTWPFGGFNPAYMVLVFTVLVAATLSTTVAAFKKYV